MFAQKPLPRERGYATPRGLPKSSESEGDWLMSAVAHDLRVVRRTFLYPHEKRTNFTPIDNDILRAVSSDEAGRVTDKMSKIYLRLVQIRRDSPFYQSDGVLCFAGEERGGEWLTGFDQLVDYLGVAPATARKALEWLKQKGIIGYVCPKGYPTRIWLNRAASSITQRETSSGNQFKSASVSTAHNGASFFCAETAVVPAFKESHGHEELSSNLKPHALVSAAETRTTPISASSQIPADVAQQSIERTHQAFATLPLPDPQARSGILGERPGDAGAVGEVKKLTSLVMELQRKVSTILPDCASAVRAEVDDQLEFQFRKIRQFLYDKAMPQAARTGQQEAYKILRRHGAVSTEAQAKRGVFTGASDTSSVESPAGRTAPETRLTRARALELAESIWLENTRTGEPIEKTFGQFLWLWEAQQQFEPEELKLLREVVEGPEVQQRLRRRKNTAEEGCGNLSESLDSPHVPALSNEPEPQTARGCDTKSGKEEHYVRAD